MVLHLKDKLLILLYVMFGDYEAHEMTRLWSRTMASYHKYRDTSLCHTFVTRMSLENMLLETCGPS